MKDQDLLKAMSDIDPQYILEADPDNTSPKVLPFHRRRAVRTAAGLAAACFLAIIGITTYRVGQSNMKNDTPLQGTAMREDSDMPDAAVQEAPLQEAAKSDTAVQDMAAPDAAMPDAAASDAAEQNSLQEAYEEDLDTGAEAAAWDEMEEAWEAVAEAETEAESETETETETEK